ncbi:MAG: tyrosine/phenylalanine carboxypeptidase domain-containing protein [Candidatus Absconditabacterales bacterium]
MNGKYNPQFKYKWPTEERLDENKLQLDQIYEKLKGDTIKSDFKKLFVEKVDELYDRLNLIKACKKQDFDNILKYNINIFGNFDNELLKTAKEKIFSNINQDKEILGKILSLEEIQKAIEIHLLNKGIYGVDVVSNYTNLSRISITMGKKIKINIGKGAIFREKSLESVLAHEIDTHLIRYINGMKSGWEIFKSGTGYYLQDEEGLAIRNSKKETPENYEKMSSYKKYYLAKESMNYNFSKIVELSKFLYPERSLEGLFKTAIKIKKGITDTSKIDNGAVFLKNKVYFDGYTKINNRINKGNSVEKLIKGKLKINDLGFIV